jgi:hypothetical protein
MIVCAGRTFIRKHNDSAEAVYAITNFQYPGKYMLLESVNHNDQKYVLGTDFICLRNMHGAGQNTRVKKSHYTVTRLPPPSYANIREQNTVEVGHNTTIETQYFMSL